MSPAPVLRYLAFRRQLEGRGASRRVADSHKRSATPTRTDSPTCARAGLGCGLGAGARRHSAAQLHRRTTDWRFTRANLNVEEPIGQVTRPFSAATGCCARLLQHVRTGAEARVTARGQVGGGRHELACRRTRARGNGGGYQAMRWSNSKAGTGWSSGSAAGSCSVWAASHRGGPRAGAMPALSLSWASNLRR